MIQVQGPTSFDCVAAGGWSHRAWRLPSLRTEKNSRALQLAKLSLFLPLTRKCCKANNGDSVVYFGISGNIKLIASWTCVSRILMHRPTFTGNRKQFFRPHEREKKKKYLQACLDHRCHFTPFVVSCDGVLAKVVPQTLQEASPRSQESPIPKLQTS